MSTKLNVRVPFLSKEGTSSPGFVIKCLDERVEYCQGDILEFSIILFGSAISFIPQFIYSIHKLGRAGIGSGKNKYRLIGIYNSDRLHIWEDGSFKWIIL